MNEATAEIPRELPATTKAEATPLERAAQRVDKAVDQVNALEEESRASALELKLALEEFHKLGLRKIIQRLKEDPQGKQHLFALIDEPEVFALFAMHGLVRPDVATRVKTVIKRIRSHVQSQGADVEFVDSSASTATVKLIGGGTGCSSTAAALRADIEAAIKESVREISEVNILSESSPAQLIPIEALLTGSKKPTPPEKWVQGPMVDEVIEGKPFPCEIGTDRLLFIRFGDRIQAFENACAHQGLPLDRGIFDLEAGTITCPWHGFRFDCLSGECLTAPQAQLRTIPVRVKAAHIEVRIQ